MKYRITFGLLAVAALAAGLWVLARPSRKVAASPAAQGHGMHRAPVKGSYTYQYGPPRESGLERTAYYPAPPPPSKAVNGVREFKLTIREDLEHEVAPGVKMPAWGFNGTVPGPVLRATEGDLVRVTFVNEGKLPHTIHFHGIHPAKMDGVFELVPPGGRYTYEFVARPYGIMPYHCHTMPTSQHIHNGLYGMMIIDPKEGRKPMRELAMMMSAFDLDRDGEADFYAWNGRAFQYAEQPIQLEQGEAVRMYVVNMFEESMVPHLHGTMYHLYPTGTAMKPTEYTDVKTLNIAERAILEFQYDDPGTYMFQCHVSEHMEQGLMGWFEVGKKGTERAGLRPGNGGTHAHRH